MDRSSIRYQPHTDTPSKYEQDALDCARTFGTTEGLRVLALLERLADKPGMSTADPNPHIAIGLAYKDEMMKSLHRYIADGKNPPKRT